MATELPHFTLPFRFVLNEPGSYAADVAEQESVAEIATCCEAIIRTVQGQRSSLPEFGRAELEFNTDPDMTRTALAGALLEWEPRVESLIEAAPDSDDMEIQVVRALIAPADDEEGDEA